MNEINVKLKRMREGAALPAYATEGSAAVDLRAVIDAPVILAPGERALIPTGIAIAPETSGVVAIVAARSGLSIKHGITLTNGIGVIDSDYRGPLGVGLRNTTNQPYDIRPCDRIAQMMIVPVVMPELELVEELDETDRGFGGFGSTGR